MSIANWAEKINSAARGPAFSVSLIFLAGLLGLGLGRLWQIETSREPLTINSEGTSTVAVSTPSPTAASAKEGTTTSSGKYVASRLSNKYHLPRCPGALRIKAENKIWFDSKEAAEKAGFTPAANCPGI